MSTEPEPVNYVRLPDVHNPKGQTFACFAPVSDRQDQLWFDLKAKGMASTFRRLSVGHVYAIPTEVTDAETNARRLSFGKAQWVGPHDDPELVAGYQAAQKALDLQQELVRKEEKEATPTSELQRILEPLRQAYSRVPYPQRVGFELWLLSQLRKAA